MAVDEKEKRIALLLEDLASLEDYVYDLFNFAPLPICFVSPMGIILEVNPAFERISKFDLEEIVGESVNNIFEESKIDELTREVLKQGYVEGEELRFFPKGKESIPVQVFGRARKNQQGKVVGLFLGLFDLTTIKKTENELREAQSALFNILEDTEAARQRAEQERNRTQTIINHFTDGIIVFDGEDRVSMVNPQAASFLKIKPENVIGKSIKDFAEDKKLKGIFDI